MRTEYEVVARSSRPGPLPFVLKDGETFAVFDPYGDIRTGAGGGLGVFHEGARHISLLELRLWNHRPLLLSSTVREDNCMLVAHLTNPDLGRHSDETWLPKGTVHVQRATALTPAACVQELVIASYAEAEIAVPVALRFDADFRDIFEIRGTKRARRGQIRRTTHPTSIQMRYRGLDERDRWTVLTLCQPVAGAEGDSIWFTLPVPPGGSVRLCFVLGFREPGIEGAHPEAEFGAAVERSINRLREARQTAANIRTSNEQFDQWLNRSFSDVHLLATETSAGLYPYAGVPWFSTPFGRDGIITAREMLTIEPRLSRGVLGYLAEEQATKEEPENDAEPGKILHESRQGEMAALREVPFGRYYGSIDSTPLFMMLAGDYLRHTGDLAFIREIWPNITAAAAWMRRSGDLDGDGFLEYRRRTEAGLRNQGWKDSEDSISHADGRLAEGPIALCEVQAYAYGALRAAEEIATALGRGEEAAGFGRSAVELKGRFDAVFWRPELSAYALALDGAKRPCDVKASNAGHALWTGIATPERAGAVARTLLSPACFNGWGVRTLAKREARYNPMGYHNGSIWPHDNALIALGLARYGFKTEAMQVMTGLFDAANFMPMHRLPELFCGFDRRSEEGPTLYPVACMPQAWASGAVFALLEACLGLYVDINVATGRPTVHLRSPVLPPYLEHVLITNLRAGEERVDLEFHRHATDVGVNAVRRNDVDVVIVK